MVFTETDFEKDAVAFEKKYGKKTKYVFLGKKFKVKSSESEIKKNVK